jgi:predicted HAD superfamily Cof-like phosphohydrolase
MKEQLNLVKKFHIKFKALISDKPSLIPKDRVALRHRLMKEEVEEYLAGAESGDIENIAKELSDILYAVYGTIIEHGLQDKMEEIFQEVHRSQMSKDYHQYKMIKGKNYTEADIKKIIESK